MGKRIELWAVGLCMIGMATPQWTMANGTARASMVGMGATAVAETRSPEANDKVESTTASKAEASETVVPDWLPRRSGTRAARVGGATRGATQDVTVHALVPQYDAAALTLSAEPTLYWHVSETTPYSVNFTLVDPDAIDPLVDVTLPGPFASGVHAVDLTAHSAKLESGKQYYWFVAVMPNPERRSADIIARGAVERVEADPALQSALEEAADRDRVDTLAREGIWYDALEALTTEMERNPDETAPRIRRNALLEQVGLIELVSAD